MAAFAKVSILSAPPSVFLGKATTQLNKPGTSRGVPARVPARRRRVIESIIEPLNRLKIEADFQTPIASGSFGEVYFGKLKSSNERVVLKKAHSTNLARKLLTKERNINRKLQTHDKADKRSASARTATKTYWPKYLGEYVKDSQFFLVWRMEGDGQTLSDYLSTRPLSHLCDTLRVPYTPGATLQAALFRRVTGGLLHALRELHARGIIHRDVKPANTLIVRDGVPKTQLIDFGSGVETRKLFFTAGVHTLDPLYAAPERRVSVLHPEKFDVFSVGLIGLSVLLPCLAASTRLREFRAALDGCDFDLRRYREVWRARSGGALSDGLAPLFDGDDAQAGDIFQLLCGMLKKSPGDRTSVQSALLSLGMD